jgi:hypothetical protein
MRGRRGRLVLGGLCAALCAALVAACSTAVGGRGTFAEGASGPSGGPASTGSGTSSPGSTSPGGSPTASATSSPGGAPGRQSLSCTGAKVISPAGAPYCYATPAGFTDVSSSVTVDTSVGKEKFRTAVAVADRDLIIVTVYELLVDTDSISDESLEQELKGVLSTLASQGFTFDSTTAKRSAVDGARSFSYHAREAKNQLQADVYFIFRGRTEVEVNCQWQRRQADITRGCQQVLSSLQIKSIK